MNDATNDLTHRHGRLLVIVGATVIPVAFLLSDGYVPDAPIASLLYSMSLSELVCWDAKVPYHVQGSTVVSIEELEGKAVYDNEKHCIGIPMRTKHLIVLCMGAIAYGIMMMGMVKRDPIPAMTRACRAMVSAPNAVWCWLKSKRRSTD